MKSLRLYPFSIIGPLVALSVALAGCVGPNIKVPPGSLAEWVHTDSYGPWQDQVTVTDVTRQADGTFILGHYDGHANFLGFGIHDTITALHIDGTGNLVPAK